MEAFEAVIRFFQTGGVFMYPIVIVLAIGLAIAVERLVFLNRTKRENRQAWYEIEPLLNEGKFQAVLMMTKDHNTAMDRVIGYGLSRAGGSQVEIEMAMEEGLMEVIPKLEKRTPYLATFANIATLLGLLGTIIGLIQAFTAVASASAADKADLLSASISVAMNTTAFGLMVGIPLLLLHAFLVSKTTEIIDSLEMVSVKFVNQLMRRRRSKPKAAA
ncbi:MAG TPA: flagellar motor protein MotA [Gammaproteobacteria bacterium]|nr:flagellar motor protein MotA [Gammaproteobacteria bacterium]